MRALYIESRQSGREQVASCPISARSEDKSCSRLGDLARWVHMVLLNVGFVVGDLVGKHAELAKYNKRRSNL